MNPETTGPSRTPIVWRMHEDDAGGRVIHVVVPDRASVILLRNLFGRIGDLGFPTNVIDQPRMRLAGIAGLQLRRVGILARKTLTRAADGTFVWACSREQSLTNAAMIEPFRKGQTGHQYLTSEDIDDALIEVSFGEQQHQT